MTMVVKAVVTLLRVDEDEDPVSVLAGLESAISCSGISDFEVQLQAISGVCSRCGVELSPSSTCEDDLGLGLCCGCSDAGD